MSESSTESMQCSPESASQEGGRGTETLERAAVELASANRNASGRTSGIEASCIEQNSDTHPGILSEEQQQAQVKFLREIERLEAELKEAKEAVLRAQAEMQNARRRAEKDIENAHKFSLEKFVRELLPVMDGLEKTIESLADQEVQEGSLGEGVALTLKMFTDLFAKFGVESVSPAGQVFNPQVHEAMCLQPTADVEPNNVVAVMQKGYLLNGRLVRPARVVVSRAL